MKKKANRRLKPHAKIKIGKKVKIISGREKGKVGLVKKILKQNNRLIIEGINIRFKHIKPTQTGQAGEIKRIEFPIHSSNVSLYAE
uniref:Large ribosomal subunit protein uL24c n=1 Tax=Pleurocladia lacustris TaxID=246121 RepID=A0A1I9LVK4_9PHAE|nr:50S ribosomal protein L24 [Pleurocladia lacustris]ANS57624.1 50S ribosomal protein L24 [Pleurocladia lacustris]ANS57768.1 50S ribosomal protein L24 [Pleurocladia lacustris]